ncbi:MAG: DUF86 domain-containing protein [Hadesarchaea archaeon]|nr:DUF86 domain-containing protein [Hadesarchaea archaeon]
MEDWRRYQRISLDELRRDRDKRNMVLHALLVSIQATIDIANHLIAERSLKRPSTYRESFQILSEEGMISSELSDELSELAGFRNVLVHLYWGLDLEKVYGILVSGLKVVEEFRKIVKKIISLGFPKTG